MEYFHFLLFIAVCQAAVLNNRSIRDVEDLPAPTLIRLTAEDPFGYKIEWAPVKSVDEADPILGYKVKVWEQPRHKVYKYEIVNGVKELVEELVPVKFPMSGDVPDFEPKEVLITKADVLEAKSKNIEQGMIYEFRVQAFTEKGDGPLSAPMRLEYVKPKKSDHDKDMYVVA